MRGKGTVVLAATTVACGILVAVVHDQQVTERDALHQGVLRDKELYRRKLQERAGRSTGG
jgi:hypothetical protein